MDWGNKYYRRYLSPDQAFLHEVFCPRDRNFQGTKYFVTVPICRFTCSIASSRQRGKDVLHPSAAARETSLHGHTYHKMCATRWLFLLFLRNDSSPEKIDPVLLLYQVSGTVFVPETFRQHCQLSSSTGVVPLSKFKKVFERYDIEMLIAFMTHLELCFEIKDKQVLEYIHKTEPNLNDTRYLFFHGLRRIEAPESLWEEDTSMSYHFGWMLKTSQDKELLDPRCFQVLILRIVFMFCGPASSSIVHINIPSLHRFCFMWKNGIYWCNDDGITAHLELDENGRSLVFKMRSDTVRPEGLIHRSRIVSIIRETVESFGHTLNRWLIQIKLLRILWKIPLTSHWSTSKILQQLFLTAEAQSNRHNKFLLASSTSYSLSRTLAWIKTTIQCIHSDKNAKKDEKISRAFISHLIANSDGKNPDQVTRNSRMYRRILSQSQALVGNIQSVSPRQEVVQALEKWRIETEGTYSCLRETLNKYSVFSGRNPLVSGCMLYCMHVLFIVTNVLFCPAWANFYTLYFVSGPSWYCSWWWSSLCI